MLAPNHYAAFRVPVPLDDLGNDEIAWNMGYQKYWGFHPMPDAYLGQQELRSNDVPMFRIF